MLETSCSNCPANIEQGRIGADVDPVFVEAQGTEQAVVLLLLAELEREKDSRQRYLWSDIAIPNVIFQFLDMCL